jgi:excisionase family DNA binding protein
MRKITFDTLPSAVAEILDRLDRIEKMISKPLQINVDKVKKSIIKKGDDIIDLKDAAKILNVSNASLYSYVKNKRIPFKKEGRRLIFSSTALEEWKQKKSNVRKKKDVEKEISEKISAQEAQKLFNKPLATIYYLIKSRKLQVLDKKGRTLYYSKKELSHALKNRLKKSLKKI